MDSTREVMGVVPGEAVGGMMLMLSRGGVVLESEEGWGLMQHQREVVVVVEAGVGT